MLDYTEVRRSIETLLDTELTSLTVIFENTKLSDTKQAHVTLTDADVKSEKLSMTENVYKVTGILTFHIFTESGTGTELARETASEIISLLEASDIAFKEFTFSSVGKTEENYLYHHKLSAPYDYVYGQNT